MRLDGMDAQMQSRPGKSPIWKYGFSLAAGLALLLCLDLLGFDSHLQLWLSVALAFSLFILPGGLLITAAQGWLPLCLPRFVSYGFAISLLLISIIGIVARSLHWTFAGILLIWFCLTLASLLAFVFKARRQRIIGSRPERETLFLILIILITLSLFAYSGMHLQPLRNDQHALNALTLAYQDGAPLDWQERFYDSGGRIHSRHYLTYWELAKALMSQISGQHLLRADFIINSLLMLVAVCAVHTFARDLGASPRTAWLIVLLHLCCFALLLGGIRQPGAQFVWRLVEDKLLAGFVVAPLALSAAHRAYTAPSRQTGAAFFLGYLALLFAHVMMAGFVLIAIVIAFAPRLFTASRQRRSSALAILLMALLVISPGIVLRLQIGSAESAWNFGSEPIRTNRDVLAINLRNPLTGESLYAINPSAAGPLSYGLLALVVLTAALRRGDKRSWLLVALTLTACVGLLPLTAWLYGRLVSVAHMMRVMWIIPYGFMLYFVLAALWGRLRSRVPLANEHVRKAGLAGTAALTLLSSAHFLAELGGGDFSQDVAAVIESRQDWIELGEFLDAQHAGRARFLSSPDRRNQVLSSSYQAIALSRYHVQRMVLYSNMPVAEAQQRTEDHFRFWEDAAPLQDRLVILRRYDIDYLLYTADYADIVQELMSVDSLSIELVLEKELFRLARVE